MLGSKKRRRKHSYLEKRGVFKTLYGDNCSLDVQKIEDKEEYNEDMSVN